MKRKIFTYCLLGIFLVPTLCFSFGSISFYKETIVRDQWNNCISRSTTYVTENICNSCLYREYTSDPIRITTLEGTTIIIIAPSESLLRTLQDDIRNNIDIFIDEAITI